MDREVRQVTTRSLEGGVHRALTRKDFLKLAGSGAALLGASALSSGCGPRLDKKTGTNVVVVIIDSLRKDHVGAYGNPWIKTPNLDALSRESLRFTQAYPESAPTICARRAIHTGRRTWPFRDWQQYKGIDIRLWGWQPIPEGQTTLAEILRDNGFATMLVTDTLHQFRPSMNFQRGFDVFDFIRGQTTDSYRPIWTSPPGKAGRALLKGNVPDSMKGREYLRQYFANTAYRETEEDWFSPRVFARAAELLGAAREGQPFFLVVDGYDPHAPYDPPERYVSLYDGPYEGPEPYLAYHGPSEWLTERQLERLRALYAGEVTMTDHWLGYFLEKMEELGLFRNTLLLLLSDHGVAHGEHGILGKPPMALWPEVTDVPFLVRSPGGERAGETSDYYASTHDVAPTVLGFLGIEPPQPMDGQDLSVLLDSEEPEERAHFTLGFHDYVWARDDQHVMFSRYDGTKARLYDLGEDPALKNDIAGERPDVVRRMFDDYVLKEAGGPLPNYDL
jgi:arylsulfatase A-like enzyme